MTAIGREAIADCKSLESITLPESVTTIGNCAFADCKSLARITIPESLRDDGREAFDDKVQAIIRHV